MRCSLLTLSCYLDSELEARQHGEMEAHLVGCPRCRAGLSHLREEMERVGGLARVRVPDRSARAMMELLGLIARGQDLPPRPADVPDAPVSELPWLGAQVGPALPWASPPRVPRGTPPPSPSPAAAAPPAAAAAVRPDELPVLTAPAAAPGRTAEQEAAREEADVALMGPVDLPRPAVPIIAAALVPPRAPASTVPPAPSQTVAPVPSPASDVPPTPIVSDAPPAPAAPAPASDVPPIPIVSDVPPAPAAPEPPPPPVGETPVAVSLPDTPEALSPLAGPAADAPGLDPLAGALFAAAAEDSGPLPAPRPSLFDRFREKLAMRRALSGNPDADLEDGVEVVSGMGAPLRSGSSRADLARRRSEALRPAAVDAAAAEALARGPRAGEMLPPPARPSALRPSPPTNLFGIPVDPFGRPPRAAPAPGGVQRAPAMAPPPPSAPTPPPRAFVPPALIEEQRLAAAPPPPLARKAPPAGPDPAERRPASPSELREGRRLLFLYIGAVVVLFVIGLVSARTTTPLPTSSTSTSSTSTSSTSTGSTSTRSGATAPKPAAVLPGSTHPTAAPVAPTAAPAPQFPAIPPPAPRTVGAGGTGWQIQQFRFGDHTTYYLIVLDIAGSGPPPAVTVASQDAQTLLLTVAGTAPAAGPVLPPPGGWVSRVTLVTPSPTPGATVYRIVLSKPGAGSPSLLTGPSRIVIEIR